MWVQSKYIDNWYLHRQNLLFWLTIQSEMFINGVTMIGMIFTTLISKQSMLLYKIAIMFKTTHMCSRDIVISLQISK